VNSKTGAIHPSGFILKAAVKSCANQIVVSCLLQMGIRYKKKKHRRARRGRREEYNWF